MKKAKAKPTKPKKAAKPASRAADVPFPFDSKTMLVASWNVNGLRSVAKKGFGAWLARHPFDVVMLQEIKAHKDVLLELEDLRTPVGYKHVSLACGEKAGYSGLLTYCREEPDDVRTGLGVAKFDNEGRWLEVDLGKRTFINSYFPNSQRDHARLPYKLEFCSVAQERMQALRSAGRTVILAGDINVAHTEIDLANPKTNKDNAGFLPQEREWFTELLGRGWVDSFREFEKGPGHYTWWSYRPGVREKNVGWRLDHFFIDQESKGLLRGMWHQTDVYGSDHCPIVLSVQRGPTR